MRHSTLQALRPLAGREDVCGHSPEGCQEHREQDQNVRPHRTRRCPVTAHPEVQILMRAIKFADSASWHVGPTAMPLEQFVWPELRTAGTTATVQAIRMLAAELTIENMPRRGYPPVCILVSDGYCTDP